ncbi:MAG: imidazole glycerol phosphate synthase subunit HisH [Ignavibacteriae bacterium]|nr:imidazole glycerol phosphate synthase subunit HisH [Ignavibacteriota bacterium]NOH00260.1 imidazole glycerol phosphate synthase subunit HisH [Ignavibacteriota bacterium]
MILMIDYGAGNTASVANALDEIGTQFCIAKNISDVKEYEKIILPGVGEANYAMQQLRERGFVELIKNSKVPTLGICLGMQLFTEFSEEGETGCIGLVNCKTIKFSNMNEKVPHMGWNNVNTKNDSILFNSIKQNEYFYFAHSFYVEESKYAVASTKHGIEFASAIENKNIYGVQFHPEKSGAAGLQLIKNFGEL